jgi:dynein heavy chain, axonemal
MVRASKLVVLLKDEGVRWKENIQTIAGDIERLVGNVFLSCACISYFGPFTGKYRTQMVSSWVENCLELGIPTSEDFNLVTILGDPVELRGWNIATLPSDQVSSENGILCTQAERYGLCIDP